MKKKVEVLGLGTAVIDDILILPDFPAQNTKIDVLQRKKQAGGSVIMALKTLATLGITTSFAGKIGSDDDSILIKRHLQYSGIDSSLLLEEKGVKLSYAQVWLNITNGSRTIAVDSGNPSFLKERNIDFNFLPDCQIFHIDGKEHFVTKKLINMYKQDNVKISIDTGKFRNETVALLDLVDIIIMPLSFAFEWLGKANYVNLISKASQKYPNKLIIITDGKVGSICSYQGEIIRQKAFNVNCVDSTGVGGVFTGGILFGVLNEWDIKETLKFAAGVAALKCTKIGNTDLPKVEEVIPFVR